MFSYRYHFPTNNERRRLHQSSRRKNMQNQEIQITLRQIERREKRDYNDAYKKLRNKKLRELKEKQRHSMLFLLDEFHLIGKHARRYDSSLHNMQISKAATDFAAVPYDFDTEKNALISRKEE